MKARAILLAGIAAATAAACNDSADENTAHGNVRFSIDASASDTRTQWGEAGAEGYRMEWGVDDRITVVLSSADNMTEATVDRLSDDKLSASFEVEMPLTSQPDEYRLYACSPASAFDRITTAADNPDIAPHLAFTVPSHQCPTERSFDPATAVIFGSSTGSDILPSAVALSFTSVAAYGKITIKDLPLSEGERVESITLVASRPISGEALCYFDEPQIETIAAPSALHTIEIEYPTDSPTFSAWFTAIPASLRDGELCVCVKTDCGRYEKMIDLSGKEFVFEQNRILSFTVDMGATRLSSHPVWHRISSPEMIADRTHIIVCNGSYCSGGALSFDNHPQAVSLADADVSIDGDSLYGAVDEAMKWDFTQSAAGETIISRHGNPGSQLYASNTNNGILVGNSSYTWQFFVVGETMRAMCNKRYLGLASAGWRSYTSYNNANYISSAIELYGLYVE